MSSIRLPQTMDSASLSFSVASESSPDGSILMAGTAGNLVTSAGIWTFNTALSPGQYAILLNGHQVGATPTQELEVAQQGNMFANNSDGSWWEWGGSGWTHSSNPLPSLSPPPPASISPDGSIL